MKNVLALLVFCAFAVPASAELKMLFENASTFSNSEIWVTLQRGQNAATEPVGANIPSVTYGTNAFVWNTYTNDVGTNTQVGVLYAESVRLSDILDAGGLAWRSNAASAAVYISYGTNLPVSQYSLSGISPSATTDASYNIRYQNFEITYNPVPGDQGDITAINFYGSSVGIKSFASTNATGPALQTAGFHTPTGTVDTQLSALTGGSPSAVLTNSAGQNTRILGPTQFGVQANGNSFGPYPTFDDYFAHVAGLATNKTIISNGSAFNSVPDPANFPAAYTNADVQFHLTTNSVTSTAGGYRLESSGDIVVVYQPYSWNGTNHVPGTPTTNTHSGVSLVVDPKGLSGTNVALTNLATSYVYYGDDSPGLEKDYIVITGAGWGSFTNEITGFVNAAGVGAAGITEAQILGELSAGFAAGFIASTNTVAQYGATPLGELPSSDWWQLTNAIAFEDVQAATNFFNTYANVIYQNSSNSVYGMVYSDRFVYNTTLVNAVSNGTSPVGSWLVTIGDPLTIIPEPGAAASVVLGVIGFAVFASLRKRRRLLGG
jgi:hypothetical protein